MGAFLVIGLLIRIPIWICEWIREYWFIVSAVVGAAVWYCMHSRLARRVKRLAREKRLQYQLEQDNKVRERRMRVYLDMIAASGIEEIDAWSKSDKGVKFEERMAVYFQSLGCDVQKTKASGDFGVDLLVYNPATRQTAAVQCKCYDHTNSKVGPKAVQEVFSGMHHYKANYSMVVTNSWLTKNAKELANSNRVHFWERDELIRRFTNEQQKIQTRYSAPTL